MLRDEFIDLNTETMFAIIVPVGVLCLDKALDKSIYWIAVSLASCCVLIGVKYMEKYNTKKLVLDKEIVTQIKDCHQANEEFLAYDQIMYKKEYWKNNKKDIITYYHWFRGLFYGTLLTICIINLYYIIDKIAYDSLYLIVLNVNIILLI